MEIAKLVLFSHLYFYTDYSVKKAISTDIFFNNRPPVLALYF